MHNSHSEFDQYFLVSIVRWTVNFRLCKCWTNSALICRYQI